MKWGPPGKRDENKSAAIHPDHGQVSRFNDCTRKEEGEGDLSVRRRPNTGHKTRLLGKGNSWAGRGDCPGKRRGGKSGLYYIIQLAGRRMLVGRQFEEE